MMSSALRIGVVIVASGWACTGRAAQESNPTPGKFDVAGLNEQQVVTLFLCFQKAIANHDKKAVAAMMDYPSRVVLASGKTVTVRDRRDFQRRYDAIFDRDFEAMIAATQVDDLWASWRGVATPRGEIWINESSLGRRQEPDELKIRTINNLISRNRAQQ